MTQLSKYGYNIFMILVYSYQTILLDINVTMIVFADYI
jgi:hypothetical protein